MDRNASLEHHDDPNDVHDGRAAQLEQDRAAYLAQPERPDEFSTDAETWGAE